MELIERILYCSGKIQWWSLVTCTCTCDRLQKKNNCRPSLLPGLTFTLNCVGRLFSFRLQQVWCKNLKNAKINLMRIKLILSTRICTKQLCWDLIKMCFLFAITNQSEDIIQKLKKIQWNQKVEKAPSWSEHQELKANVVHFASRHGLTIASKTWGHLCVNKKNF